MKHPRFIEEFLCDWKSYECIADIASLQVSHQCQWWQEIQQWWSKQGTSMHCLCIQSFFDCSFVDFLELLSSTVAVLSRQIGNYNVLLQSCPVELYDVDRINWAARRQKRCCMVICAKRRFGRGPITRKIPQRFCSLPLGVARGKAQKCISVEVDDRWLSMIVPYVPHFLITLPRSSLLHQGSPSRGVTGAILLEAMKAPWAKGWLRMGRDCPADFGVRYWKWWLKNTQNKTQGKTSIVFNVLCL